MALDPAPLATAAAEFLDELEERFGPELTLTRFAIVAEVEDDDVTIVRVHVAGVDGTTHPTEAAGLLARAAATTVAQDEV